MIFFISIVVHSNSSFLLLRIELFKIASMSLLFPISEELIITAHTIYRQDGDQDCHNSLNGSVKLHPGLGHIGKAWLLEAMNYSPANPSTHIYHRAQPGAYHCRSKEVLAC